MFTMGHMAACVVAGPARRPRSSELTAQFRAPVLMGEEIVAGGRVRSVDPAARTATLERGSASTRDGRTEMPVRRGEAVVLLRGRREPE